MMNSRPKTVIDPPMEKSDGPKDPPDGLGGLLLRSRRPWAMPEFSSCGSSIWIDPSDR